MIDKVDAKGHPYSVDDKSPVVATHVSLVEAGGLPTLYFIFGHFFVDGVSPTGLEPMLSLREVEPVAKVALTPDAIQALKTIVTELEKAGRC